jgi:GTPase SAR1 family protein
MNSSINTLRIQVLGSIGVGKTNLVRRFRDLNFEKRYIATKGTEVSQVDILTNHGTYCIHFYDSAGLTLYQSPNPLKKRFDASILVYDVNHDVTGRELVHWFSKCAETDKVMIIGNKTDLSVSGYSLPTFVHNNPRIPNWRISALSDDVTWLLRHLLRQITGFDNLEILGDDAWNEIDASSDKDEKLTSPTLPSISTRTRNPVKMPNYSPVRFVVIRNRDTNYDDILTIQPSWKEDGEAYFTASFSYKNSEREPPITTISKLNREQLNTYLLNFHAALSVDSEPFEAIQFDLPGIPTIQQKPAQLMDFWEVCLTHLSVIMTPEAWPHRA